MSKRRRKPQPIPMQVGHDPALWRFDSLQHALTSSVPHIAQLIRAGEQIAETTAAGENASDSPAPDHVSWSAAGD